MEKYNCFLAPWMEIHNDLCMRNVVMSCLDFDKPQSMYDKANFFLDIIFREPPSFSQMELLMGLFDKITTLDTPLKSYAKFFVSPDNIDIATTTFAFMYSLPPWAYQIVPKNAEKPVTLFGITKALQKKYKQNIVKTNSSSIVLDIFMEIDEEERKNPKMYKMCPVRHFYIDLKGILLQRSLVAARDGDKEFSAKQEGFNNYEMAYFFKTIKDCYSKNIDMQRDIRACIDAMF